MIDKDKILTTTRLREIQIEELMTCIVLFGDTSQGKSTTLSHLIVLLTGGGTLKKSIQEAFERAFPVKNGRYPDSRHIIHFKREEDKKEAIIYVSTKGDTWDIVEQNFKFFYRIWDRHIDVYHFNGKDFVKCKAKPMEFPCPLLCISPASFQKGAIQAERYLLDNTCLAWKRERWIRKQRIEPIGIPVKGYKAGLIKGSHARIAEEIVDEIKRMMDNTYI